MDPVSLFFNPQGRIGKGPFWIGVIVLTLIGQVLSAASVFGPRNLSILFAVLVAALIYPRVCVFVKRLHDANATGWWVLAVFAGFFVVTLIASSVAALPNAEEARALMEGVTFGSPEFGAAIIEVAKLTHWYSSAAIVAVWLVTAFIVSMLPSDPAENRFGAPTKGAAPVPA